MAEPRQRDLADLLTTHEQQLRGIMQQGIITWDNFRWANGQTGTSSGGVDFVLFDTPFPTTALAVTCNVHDGPWFGFRIIGTLTPSSFKVSFWNSAFAAYNGSYRIDYIAVGF